MSEQEGGLLNTVQSFDFNRGTTGNYCSNTIDSNRFADWQKDHMYKSSYAHFHSKDSSEPKNKAIPGYGGYAPLNQKAFMGKAILLSLNNATLMIS